MAYIIMSDEFEKLCEITAHKSILWHELYLDPTGGDFRMELAADRYLPYIKKGYYIINEDSEKFGIIDTFEVKDTEEDGLLLTVSGQMGESILQRRVIWPTVSMTGTTDEVVAAIIRMNITAPSNQSRQIANFVYLENPEFSDNVSKQITGAQVGSAIVSIVGQFGYAYVVTIDAKQKRFVMRLIKGKDRSANQTENPVILFSAEDFGISEFTYLTSEQAVFSHVICAGEGYGAERASVIYPTTSTDANRGLNRREVFLDKQDLTRSAGEDATLTEEGYIQKLEYEAAEKLKESATSEACEGVIRPRRYRLYRDFLAGDIVSVRNERLGLEYDIRVLGALVSIDENGAKDTTAEMGNLVVPIIQDDPAPEEDDIIEEEEEEPVIDPTEVSLREDFRPFTFTAGSLAEVNSSGAAAEAVGKPHGWVHICDNQNIEIIITASARYYQLGSGNYMGKITFTLTPQQHSVLGDKLKEELAGLMFPVITVQGTTQRTGLLTITTVGTEYGKNDRGQKVYTYTLTPSLSISASGTFALLINGIRAVHNPPKTPEPQPDTTGAGLYDADGNLVASWDELTTTYGLNVATDYSVSSGSANYYQTCTTSLYYILTNNAALNTGVRLVIPRTVYTIGDYALYGCGSLTNVELPTNVTAIGYAAFGACTKLTSIVIPNNVTDLGEWAFNGCTALTSVTLSARMTSIGNYTFQNCKLTSITIPASVTSISRTAFNNVSTIGSIVVEDGNTVYHSDGNCLIETATNTLKLGCKASVIPSDGSVTTIGEYAFNGCKNLYNIDIPDAVTTISNNAFYNCSGLKSVDTGDGVTTIGEATFYNCTKLTTVNLGANVTTIGENAFANCTALTNVELPDSLTYIDSLAFTGCTNLTSAVIPNSVTSVEFGTYYGCKNLASVHIGSSVASIESWAFMDCAKLTSVTLPASVKTLASQSFQNSGLTALIIENAETIVTMESDTALKWTPIAKATGYIYVPDNLYEQYLKATNWSIYAAQIKPRSELAS